MPLFLLSAPRSTVLALVVGRTVAAPISRTLTPAALGVAMVGAFLVQVVPWTDLQTAATLLSPGATACVAGGVLAAQAALVGPAVGRVLFGGRLDALWRQPLGGGAWAVALAPWLLTAALMVAVPAAFWGGPHRLAGVLVWVGAGALAVGGAAAGAPSLTASAAVGGAAMAAAGQAMPVLRPLAAALALATLSAAGPICLRRAQSEPAGRASSWWRPRGPFSALALRDLRCLLRTGPRVLLAALGPGALAAGWLGLAWGGMDEAQHQLAPTALLALGAVALPLPLARLRGRLGHAIDPPDWPVTPLTRVLSLALIPLGLTSITIAALSMGGAGWRALGAAPLALALAPAAVALSMWSPPTHPRPVNLGTWVGLSATLAVVHASLGPAASLVMATMGLAVAARRIDQHRSLP